MNRSAKKLLSVLLAAIFIVPLPFNSGRIKASGEKVDNSKIHSILSKKLSKQFSSEDIKKKLQTNDNFNDNAPLAHTDPNDTIRVIVQMKDKPILQETKNTKGIKAAIASKTKQANALKKQQDAVISKAKKLKGAKIRNNFIYTANGFSMDIKRSELDKLKALKGVKSVKEANKYTPDMAYAKALTQAYSTWHDYGYKGQGTVVAVLDSGIDVTHKDMRLSDSTVPKLTEDNVKIGDDDPGKYYTKKIPYAYNFADKNDDMLDTNPLTGMHGMHVAGIVAANGIESETERLQAIQGVAPEAQILSLRVFSNRPEEKYAYSDDIAAAIESAVTHQADVINMSLGSIAGFQDPNDVEQEAIRNASENGVIVVVSAGNSAYSTYTQKFANVVDTGLVGAPGIAQDALQVASYENTNVTVSLFEYSASSKNGKLAYMPADINPTGILTAQYDMVDCNLGTTADFEGKNLEGKIALVKRGGITFVEKQLNAQKAKAVGIIVYNKDGAEDYVKMAGDPQITIPAIFIKNSDGVQLKNLINGGVKVSFKGEVAGIDNTNKNQMSDFTSWGPAPNLAFKPEIAAPGGQIYSTVNNSKYESMSGTSMASPHVAGAEALLAQAIREKNLDLQGIDLINYAKATSINTAVPKLDSNGIPFSPRRQGAGLIQIEDAIKNNVTVTDLNGNAAVALKELNDKKTTVRLMINNYSDKDVTYKFINNGGVLTEVKEAEGMSSDVVIPGASLIFDKDQITIPKNDSKIAYVTISLPDNFDKQQFVEGFIKLQPVTTGIPALNVPYMGFYGNWSNMEIIDRPMWDNNTVYGTTTLITSNGGKLSYLGVDGDNVNPQKIAISPNDDGYSDIAIPYLVFLRNAKNMNITIQKRNGEIVRDISNDTYITKDVINEQNGSVGRYDEKWTWDGKIKNSDTGLLEVKEGQYFVVIKSKIDYDNATYQDFEMPVMVDVTAPEIQLTSSKVAHTTKYMLKWKAKDQLSGIGANGVMLNGTLLEDVTINNLGNDEYCCELNLNEGDNDIDILSLDNANNMSQLTTKISCIPLNITFDNLVNDMRVKTPQLNVTGRLNCQVKNLLINGVNAVINNDLTFSAAISLPSVTNDVTVKAIDFDETVLKDYTIRVYCDTTPPTMNFVLPKVDGDGKVYTNKDSITVQGSVYDDTFGYNFYINGELKIEVNLPEIGGETGTKRDFNYEVPVTNGCKVEIKAVDTVGNEAPVKTFDVVVDKEKPVITITTIENGKSYNHDLLPQISTNEGTITSVTLNGNPYNYNNEVISNEGNYKLIATAVDKAGNTAVSEVNFTIDKTNPIINITGVEEGKYYNTDVTPVVTTNEGTLTMTLNGKDYNGSAIKADGEYVLVAKAVDAASNSSESTVKFVIDKTNPVINITGVEDGKYYNKDVTPVVTANEGTLTMKLNGNDYNGEVISAEGQYELVATAVDKAGNITQNTVKFVIDKTNPVISVTGVEDGKYYNTDVTPGITSNEGTLTMKLNGKDYKGEVISAEGKYELIILVVDKAGNSSQNTIKFFIDKTSPKITVKGVEDGKTYTTSVKPQITCSEGKLTITLDNNKYNGEEITALGKHQLIIVSIDKANNTTKKIINFSIEKPKSKLVQTGYFFDLKVCILIGALFIGLGAFMIISKKKHKKLV